MSKFYSRYCERNGFDKPTWLVAEEHANEVHKQHVNQAMVTTTSKHVGSKNQHKLNYNRTEVIKRVKKYNFLSRLFSSIKKKNI